VGWGGKPKKKKKPSTHFCGGPVLNSVVPAQSNESLMSGLRRVASAQRPSTRDILIAQKKLPANPGRHETSVSDGSWGETLITRDSKPKKGCCSGLRGTTKNPRPTSKVWHKRPCGELAPSCVYRNDHSPKDKEAERAADRVQARKIG